MIEETLQAVLEGLRSKQATYPRRERALAITNIEQGMHWLEALEKRERDQDEPPMPPPFAGGGPA